LPELQRDARINVDDQMPESNAPSRKTILLAEDNESSGAIARMYLDSLGYDVTWARNGAEAVDCRRARHFDLILMDAMMPVMDGFEATRQIRLYESGLDAPPSIIIALTANAANDDERKCLDLGMDGFVGKPYKFEQLRKVLDEWLRR
jgi:CheY-like chemotaxis protein